MIGGGFPGVTWCGGNGGHVIGYGGQRLLRALEVVCWFRLDVDVWSDEGCIEALHNWIYLVALRKCSVANFSCFSAMSSIYKSTSMNS